MREVFAKLGEDIRLGRRGENLATRVTFDVSGWMSSGDGTIHLLHQRNGDNVPYPCAITVDGGTVKWAITAADVEMAGRGRAELQYLDGDVCKKSAIYTTNTLRALNKAGKVPPEPEEGWVQEVLEAKVAADNAASEAKTSASEAKTSAENAYDSALTAGACLLNTESYMLAAQSAAQTAAEDAAQAAVAEAENRLVGYQTNAASSAQSALQSSQGAAQSAQEAGQSALAATAAQKAAEEAQSAAETAADAAAQSEGNAKTFETNAAASAKEAKESAQGSAQAAGIAQIFMNAAEQSALAAGQAAQQAADRAVSNVYGQMQSIVNDAQAAAGQAQSSAENANMAADNARSAEVRAEAAIDKQPRIVNGTWHVWDANAGVYVDTGETAHGTQGEPGRGMQADWSQNDSTADDYIKNRPFYASDSGEVVKLPNEFLDVAYIKKVAGAEDAERVLTSGWGSLKTVQGYINTSGTITEHVNYIASDFIPAIVGTDIAYNIQAATGVCCFLAMYDVNKAFMKSVSLMAEGAAAGTNTDFTGTYTIPDGVAFFRIMDYKSKAGTFTYYIERGEMQLSLVSGWGELNSNAGYLVTNGTLKYDVNYVTSDYLPAFPGKTMTYNVQSVGSTCCVVAVYDGDKNYLSDVSVLADGSASRRYYSGAITFPENAAFFRIMDYKEKKGTFAYYDYVEVSSITPWTGKRWFAFGTSITDTSYTNAETGTPTGKYAPYLVEMSGLVIDNHGIAGGTIGKGGAHGGSANILNEIFTTDLSSADLITIEGFVNDFACAVPIGELGDVHGVGADFEPLIEAWDTISICGALYSAIVRCLETAPNALVILLTESTGRGYTLKNGQSANYCVDKKNSLGKFQKDYNDAIIEMGRFMGVRVIDAGSKSQINCFNPEYIVDQIHHTELGGKQYATVIWDELKNISPKVVEQ